MLPTPNSWGLDTRLADMHFQSTVLPFITSILIAQFFGDLLLRISGSWLALVGIVCSDPIPRVLPVLFLVYNERVRVKLAQLFFTPAHPLPPICTGGRNV